MSIEQRFDVPFVASLALREKAIQQNYRPVIAVHKWFARRPGTLFRGLLLSEFVDADLRDSYFRSNSLRGKRIADPFMGGGTPLVEANRLGADIAGWDINPMAWWIVERELDDLDTAAYERAGRELVEELRTRIGDLYDTVCTKCGGPAPVKYFLWVKTQSCVSCRRQIDLFPGYLVATNARHPRNVLVCGGCGQLAEVSDRKSPGPCPHCGTALRTEGPARRGVVPCSHCDAPNRFPDATKGPLGHRMFAIEYHCRSCKPSHRGRFFKVPSTQDMAKYDQARRRWREISPRHVPDDPIPPGDESTRLHRWGYHRYRQMFNDRQLLGLETSCRLVAAQPDTAIRRALATNLSDLLRYNNLLVRYDTRTLKALDLFSVHGFPTGLVRCEANLLGILGRGGQPVGSGGWVNILNKYRAAKDYCDRPFEVALGSRTRLYTAGERIGRGLGARHKPDAEDQPTGGRSVALNCGSATQASFSPGSLDAVFTDPPYYDSVQYAELMDFCYVWLRRVAGVDNGVFGPPSTRNPRELTGNATEGRDIEHFAMGLAAVYERMAVALKPGAPLAFTYHHNRPSAYRPVAMAILDAGLAVTATLPCPAEMSGSIHINGTRSSIVDTVFVCRRNGDVPEECLAFGPDDFARLVAIDLAQLRAGGVRPSDGDVRCIALGHLTRMAVWTLRPNWDRQAPVGVKLARVRDAMDDPATVDGVMEVLRSTTLQADRARQGDLLEDFDGE